MSPRPGPSCATGGPLRSPDWPYRLKPRPRSARWASGAKREEAHPTLPHEARALAPESSPGASIALRNLAPQGTGVPSPPRSSPRDESPPSPKNLPRDESPPCFRSRGSFVALSATKEPRPSNLALLPIPWFLCRAWVQRNTTWGRRERLVPWELFERQRVRLPWELFPRRARDAVPWKLSPAEAGGAWSLGRRIRGEGWGVPLHVLRRWPSAPSRTGPRRYGQSGE